MEDPQGREIIEIDLSLPPKESESLQVPMFGMVPIPPHDFPEQFSNFCFNSLYIKEEVIRAMVQIRTECNDMRDKNFLFKTDIDKTIRLEEFKLVQSAAHMNVKSNQDAWVNKIVKIIKDSFSQVGKGWFNIEETSKETYEFGKLKKFLTVVNLMMQDTVLTLCKKSVKEFVEFMLKFVPESTDVVNTSTVNNAWRAKEVEEEAKSEASGLNQIDEGEEGSDFSQIDLEEDKKDPIPLFVLDLVLKPGANLP